MTKVNFIFLLLVHCQFLGAQTLVLPIEGVYGDDYIIVNYPDWHVTEGPVNEADGFLVDHNCGTKTYDGHQGTDFVIRSFTQMDAGVNILSIAAGEVIHVTEDLYDRETEGDVELGLGNYIGIYHESTNTYSYYAHIKTNSAVVEVGEFVEPGQVIAQVGSSGNSTDPHLHFELWNPGEITDPTIDPWGTPCGEIPNLWNAPPVYDTTFAVWEHGFVNYNTVDNFTPITWYPLKERTDLKSSFTTDDPNFTYWALQYGIKLGDTTVTKWYEPNGSLYLSDTTLYLTQDWWFHYYNHSIPRPSLEKQGEWTVRYYYNSDLILEAPITYGNLSTTAQGEKADQPIVAYLANNTFSITVPIAFQPSILQVRDLTGKTVLEQHISTHGVVEFALPPNLSAGIYALTLINSTHSFHTKILR